MQVMLVFFYTVNEAAKIVISFWVLKSKRDFFLQAAVLKGLIIKSA